MELLTMDWNTIKDIGMFGLALYGAVLATYSYNRNKVRFEVDTSCLFMVLAGKNNRLEPTEVIQLSVTNTGQSSCYIEKFGLVDSNGKFLPLETIDDVGSPSEVQPNFRGGEIASISKTNSKVSLLSEDREVKPNSKSSAFFRGKELERIITDFRANRVYAYVECSGTVKKKALDYSKFLK